MTDRCVRLIELLADPTDRRPRAQKFLDVGYSVGYGYTLSRTPEFVARLFERTKQLAGSYLPEIFQQLHHDALDPENYADSRTRASRTIMEAVGVIGANVQVNVSTAVAVELTEEARAQRIADVRARRLVAPPVSDAGRPVRAVRD